MKRSKKRIVSVILQFAAILLAIGWIVNAIVVRGAPKPPDKDNWTQRDGFVAIAFGGIARTTDGTRITRERVKEHLKALADAGYQSVTTEDLVNFYVKGEPLPDKPVYIMFEGGRKDGAIWGQDALTETGMRATMYVYPHKMDEWTRTFMTRGEVGALARSAFWEIGCHGYEMYAPGTENLERPVYYLADYLRDGNGHTLESPKQFAIRAEKDYKTAKELLDQTTGKKAAAYIFMPANLIGNSPNEEVDFINSRLLARYFPLAFTREGVGFNSRGADRHRLTRLQVTAAMTSADLIGRLGSWLTGEGPYSYRGGVESDRRWQADTGTVEYGLDEIGVVPEEDQYAFAWLTGSEDWANVDVQAQLSVRPDTELNLYLRFTSRQSFLRLHLADNTIMVQERTPARGITTILTKPVPASSYVPVRLTAKNRRLWVAVAGESLTDSPLPFADGLTNGRVAIEAKCDGEDKHQAFFKRFKATPLADILRIADVSVPVSLDWPDVIGPAGLLVPLEPLKAGEDETVVNRAIASYLLRTVGQGINTYAMLPRGSVELSPVAEVTSGVPLALMSHLWTGVVFTLGEGMTIPDVSLAAVQARSNNLATMLAMTVDEAENLIDGKRFPPVDSVLLTGEGELSESGMKALQRHYQNVMFWNSVKACYEKR